MENVYKESLIEGPLTRTSFGTIGFPRASRTSRVCAPAFHVRLTCTICKHVRLSTFLRRQDCRTTGIHPRFRGVTLQQFSMQRYDTQEEQGSSLSRAKVIVLVPSMLLRQLIFPSSASLIKTFEFRHNKTN